MNNEIILIPAALLVILTFLAWVRMFWLRIPAMKQANVDIKVVRSQKMKEMLPEDVNIGAEHFVNLFEMPVLFYCLCTGIYITDSVSPSFIYGCFGYAGLRYLHSFIHLGYNNVMHRFIAYLLSSILLWIMWFSFTWILFQKAV